MSLINNAKEKEKNIYSFAISPIIPKPKNIKTLKMSEDEVVFFKLG
jgi:hypothetical protein